MTTYWYTFRVKPRKEALVYQSLQGREVEVSYPAIKIHGLVTFGDEPAIMPAALVQELKTRLAQPETAVAAPSLQPGDKIHIIKGLLQGYEAIFDVYLPGKERVKVLLSFLSHHPQRFELSAIHLEKLK